MQFQQPRPDHGPSRKWGRYSTSGISTTRVSESRPPPPERFAWSAKARLPGTPYWRVEVSSRRRNSKQLLGFNLSGFKYTAAVWRILAGRFSGAPKRSQRIQLSSLRPDVWRSVCLSHATGPPLPLVPSDLVSGGNVGERLTVR